VLVLALCAVLLVAGGLTAAVGAVAVSRHQAAAAADLAALAGAQAVGNGGAACAEAARVASRSGAGLASCTIEGADVVVEAVVRPAGTLGRLGVARVRARAGPSRAPG
jgi:secretion/DNA translocation related TadE-like protein